MYDELRGNPHPAWLRSERNRYHETVSRGVNDVTYREQAYSWEMVVAVYPCLQGRQIDSHASK